MKPTDAQETAVIEAPFGALILRSDVDDRVLTGIDLALARSAWTEPRTPLLQEAARQFKAYFRDPRHGFDLPLALRGTA
jgi:O6-methylguanine-DNA--protein-cysteine methyltransferase